MSNMVVRTNIYALNSHRNMKNVGIQQKQASNRLSSGYRINSAADDAAGLAISETMRAQIRGLDQASRNAQDGQAMILTTEGGLEEIGNILQRVRELLVQASNDTNTQGQRDMIQQEIQQLGEEVGGMQTRVEFNTNQVLNMGTAVDVDRSAYVNQQGTVSGAASAVTDKTASLASANLVVAASVADSAESVASQIALVEGELSTLKGTLSTELTALATQDQEYRDNVLAAAKQVGTAYVAWFQVGANAGQNISFNFETVRRAVDKAELLVKHIGDAVVAQSTDKLSGIGYGQNISPMIASIQGALDEVSSVRANLGAVQNRMDYTMRSLDISSENLSDSESRVRNTDMAKEMMKFTMSNVLQQAAVSMLSQANQLPQNLLQLLR